MKVQFRSILFALVLPLAACGGDRETPTASSTQSDSPKSSRASDVPVTTPVAPITSKGTEAVKSAQAALPVPTTFSDALALGRELLAKGEYGDAKEMLEAAIALDSKKAEPHIELARLYIATSERGKSIAAAKRAIKLAPLSSQAWNTKGRAELNAHNYDNAIEGFTKAIELNQDNAFAWNNLGYTELLLKHYEDAAEHLAEATTKRGATGYMFNNLGTALEHLDRLDEARLAYEAGGKLGSKEAIASRKRLEGVASIAIARVDDAGSKAGGDQVKEYDLTDEGEITDEDEEMERMGSAASEELESDAESDAEAFADAATDVDTVADDEVDDVDAIDDVE